MKHYLRRIIGETRLTYEEITTLLAEVEACLNSRSLQALSDDLDDLEALTLGHFLIGTLLVAIPESSLITISANRLMRWCLFLADARLLVAKMGLIPRPKWWQQHGSVKESQLCLRSKNTPPLATGTHRVSSPGG